MSFSDPDRNPDSRRSDSRDPGKRESESPRDFDSDRRYDSRPDPLKSAAPRPTPRSDRPARPRPTSNRPPSPSERPSAPRSSALESLRTRTYGESDDTEGFGGSDRQARDRSSSRRSRAYERPSGTVSGSYGGGRGGFDGGGFGGSGFGDGYNVSPERESSRPSWLKFSNLSILIIVALVMFFSGFAMRDVYTAEGGFDDERPIQAEQVPVQLRDFCIQYNGYPSFSLLSVDTVSALTASSVPVLKLDTCTIPTRETANALAALGVQRRSESIGLQLGGSNLTLLVVPLADTLAQQIYGAYPNLADNLKGNTRDEQIDALQERIAELLVNDINNITLQNVIKTNLPGVFAVAPGHSFPIQPQVQP